MAISREGRFRRALTAAYYLTFLGLGLLDASLGPTLPWLAERAGTSAEELGVLFTTRACGYVLGSYLAGMLYDRVPSHRVMVVGLVVMAAALAPIPGMASVLSIASALFLAGAGAGAVDVGGNTILAWIHGDGVGPYLNGLHFFFGAGALLAPFAVARALARGIGIEWTYWSFAVFIGLAAVPVLALPSPPRRVRGAAPQTGPSHWPLAILVGASLMAYVGLELGFAGWLFTYATSARAMAPVAAADLTSSYWFAFTAGRLVSIPFMAYLTRRHAATVGDRAGHAQTLRRVLDIAMAGAALALGIMLAWRDQRALSLGSILLGFFVGPIFPSFIAVAEQRMRLSGQMTAVFLVGAGLGGMFVPWGIGIAMHKLGPGALLPAVAVNLALLLALYLAMTPALKSAIEEE